MLIASRCRVDCRVSHHRLPGAAPRIDPTGWRRWSTSSRTAAAEWSWAIAWRGAPPSRGCGSAGSFPARRTTSLWTEAGWRRPPA